MPPSTQQRTLINQFVAITGVPERNATRLLKASNWKLEQACDAFYASTGQVSAAPAKETDNLAKIFEGYRDPKADDPDTVGFNGTMRYLEKDLDLNIERADFLIPMEIVQAPFLGEMSKEGFIQGWKNVGLDTIAQQKAYIASQIKKLPTDTALYKRVYKHTFICSKEKGNKSLALEAALIYWGLLFSPPGRPWISGSTNFGELWFAYLNEKWNKSVNKDMWNQTFEFYLKTLEDETLSFWSEDSAWPGVIDEFVFYVKEKRGDVADVPESMETD